MTVLHTASRAGTVSTRAVLHRIRLESHFRWAEFSTGAGEPPASLPRSEGRVPTGMAGPRTAATEEVWATSACLFCYQQHVRGLLRLTHRHSGLNQTGLNQSSLDLKWKASEVWQGRGLQVGLCNVVGTWKLKLSVLKKVFYTEVSKS